MRINRIKLVIEMTRQDMTATRLCEISDVSRATLSAIKGGKSCTEETARKIAAGLGVDVSELLAKEA